MNDLEKYFRANNKRQIHKNSNYFEAYDNHFSRFRGKEISILEIGVSQGGSLQMWRDYFGPQAKIYGIDIDARCKDFEEENIQILIGSQSDRKFLRDVKNQIPKLDILIDDGGHTMEQQIVSYEELFDHVKDDGVYLCEDLHTSYWLKYGGGHKRRGTFIEFSKNFIDYLNARNSEQRSLRENDFTRNVNSVHFYEAIVVVEKRKRPAPVSEVTGTATFVYESRNKSGSTNAFKRIPLKIINETLRFFRLPGFIWK
jgi:hypothetical protein